MGRVEDRMHPYAGEGCLGKMYLRADSFEEVRKKILFTYWELLGTMGGVIEVTFVALFSLVGIFANRLLMKNLLDSLFMVNKVTPNDTEVVEDSHRPDGGDNGAGPNNNCKRENKVNSTIDQEGGYPNEANHTAMSRLLVSQDSMCHTGEG